MNMGRQHARRIRQNYIRADRRKRRFRVEHDTIFKQFRAIFQACNFVVQALVCQLGLQKLYILLRRLPAKLHMMAVEGD
jgi:hypothetical protein